MNASNPPAFPGERGEDGHGEYKREGHPNGETSWVGLNQGMTLRDYFAAKADVTQYAPHAILSGKLGRNPSVAELAAYIAQVRHIEAEAMLAEREKQRP